MVGLLSRPKLQILTLYGRPREISAMVPDAADEVPAYPLDGVLDLHQFHPRETKEIVEAYLEACQEEGILDVRIIHGKGIGTLREQVHRQLRANPIVARFGLGGEGGGQWGATVVRLYPSVNP